MNLFIKQKKSHKCRKLMVFYRKGKEGKGESDKLGYQD